MKNQLIRAGVAILGMVVTLAWWTIRGSNDSNHETTQGIPSKVWEGGGGTLSIEAESTCDVHFSISFSEMGEEGEKRSLSTWDQKPAGTHSWTISVPAKVGGVVEMGCESSKVGDKLSWKIQANGTTVNEQNESLQEELKPGYAFFSQVYFEDYATGKLEEDD